MTKLPNKICGIVFDLDHTLITSPLDFSKIRAAIGIKSSMPVLEYIETLDKPHQKVANEILERHELNAAKRSVLYPGVRRLFDYMDCKGIKKAIVTRNSREVVEIVAQKHGLEFDAVVTREDDVLPKPSPEPLYLAAEELELPISDLIFVGDYEFDMLAGKNAGIYTVLALMAEHASKYRELCDYAVESIEEIIDLCERVTSYLSHLKKR